MRIAQPLPPYLANRYHGWRATSYERNKSWFRHLADYGQHPRAMIIACCDSRVHVTSMFGADEGEIFVHRNIANLVPPFAPDGDHHGTSAAVEYAVSTLKVAHVVVVGHSNCGGVKGCHDMCAGHAPDLSEKASFVGRWLDILRPAYERHRTIEAEPARLTLMEKESVVVSLDNLMTFPFVAEAVAADSLSLHGVWNDIAQGLLEAYQPETGAFAPV